jgi:hypothetical protein
MTETSPRFSIRTSAPSKRKAFGRRTAWLPPCWKIFAVVIATKCIYAWPVSSRERLVAFVEQFGRRALQEPQCTARQRALDNRGRASRERCWWWSRKGASSGHGMAAGAPTKAPRSFSEFRARHLNPFRHGPLSSTQNPIQTKYPYENRQRQCTARKRYF